MSLEVTQHLETPDHSVQVLLTCAGSMCTREILNTAWTLCIALEEQQSLSFLCCMHTKRSQQNIAVVRHSLKEIVAACITNMQLHVRQLSLLEAPHTPSCAVVGKPGLCQICVRPSHLNTEGSGGKLKPTYNLQGSSELPSQGLWVWIELLVLGGLNLHR